MKREAVMLGLVGKRSLAAIAPTATAAVAKEICGSGIADNK